MTARHDAQADRLRPLVAALKTVHDPEIPVNIYDLGLIYNLAWDEKTGAAHVRMTLTAPNCPMAEQIVADVQRRLEAVKGVRTAKVELVWSPPWSAERMSEEARLALLAMGVDPDRPSGGMANRPAARLTVGRKPAEPT